MRGRAKRRSKRVLCLPLCTKATGSRKRVHFSGPRFLHPPAVYICEKCNVGFCPLLSKDRNREIYSLSLMASSVSPPILPITNSLPSAGTTTAASADGTSAPVSTPAFRLFLSRLQDSVRRSLSDRRAWSELVDRSAFSRPESLSEATSRARKNFAYFRVNYLALIAAVLALSLVTHPASLVVLLGLLASWCFLYLFRPSDPPLVLFGRTFSGRETLLGLTCLTVFVVFLTSVGSLIISALLVGAGIVAAHGAFRLPEDLFLDDQEPGAATGFLSFLGGGASAGGPGAGTGRV